MMIILGVTKIITKKDRENIINLTSACWISVSFEIGQNKKKRIKLFFGLCYGPSKSFRPNTKQSRNPAFDKLLATHPLLARGMLGAKETYSNDQ
jgi:hypothetical protein